MHGEGYNCPEDIWTPTMVAARSSRCEWREVLQACRYDPDEVYIEDARRIFQYFHLHEVKCTAVDIEELDIPSTKGLTKGISLMSCGSTG